MANNNKFNKINEALKRAAEEKEKALQKEAAPLITPPPTAETAPTSFETGITENIIKAGVDHKIVAYYNPKDPITEQFRALKAHIFSPETRGLFAGQIGNLKTIAIMSPSPHYEGKTIVAVNLSVVIAQDSEKPVLIMDCNLRRPAVDVFLGIHSDKGLSDVLTGNAQLSDALINTDIKNLTVLPAGGIPSNPAELLSSQKMKDLLGELKTKFDCIILDTPPVIPYADPRILGPLVDGVVIVARTGKTRREAILRTEDILKKVGAKVLGYVLTGIEYYIPEYIHRHL